MIFHSVRHQWLLTRKRLNRVSTLLSRSKVLPLPSLLVWGLLVSVLVSSVCLIILGRGVKVWFDGLAGGRGHLHLVLIDYASVALALAAFSSLRVYTATALGEEIGSKLRVAIFTRFLSRPLAYFEENSVGNLLAVLVSDVTVIQTVARSALSPLIRNTLVLAGAGLMMAITSWKLTALCVFTLPLPVGAVLSLNGRRRALTREVQDKIGLLASRADEDLASIATLKALGRESLEIDLFSASVDGAARLAGRLTASRAALLFLFVLLAFLALGLVLWVGGTDVTAGTMTAGTLSSFLAFALLAAGSSATLGDLWTGSTEAMTAVERVMHYFGDEDLLPRPRGLSNVKQRNPMSVRLETVTFSYQSRPEEPALRDVSFEISAGEAVALVGMSGAGKSTIIRLLLGFDAPARGKIFVDGKEISELEPDRLRSCFSVVQQEPFVYSTSLVENIRYGRPDASDSEVARAAEEAAVDLFARDLPNGMETFVGERGARLSVGQRQRIAIARAFLRGAPILIFDEATSALDPITEGVVHAAIQKTRRTRTILLIAHKLATVRTADRVVMLHRGELEAIGRHDELMIGSPRYRHLTELQLAQNSASPPAASLF